MPSMCIRETSSRVEEGSELTEARDSIGSMMKTANPDESKLVVRSCKSRCDLSYAAFREYADIKTNSK